MNSLPPFSEIKPLGKTILICLHKHHDKNILILMAVMLLPLWQTSMAQSSLCPPVVIPEMFKNYEFDHNGVAIPYRLFTPDTADDGSKLPLIVALHGAENFGAVKDQFLICAGSYALGWLESPLQQHYPSYVVAPHIFNPLFFEEGYNGWDKEKSLDLLKRLIDHLLFTERIDPNRIYLTGHSMGGIGTFTVPGHLKDYFAALVPMNTAGGCPEVCERADDQLYDHLSIWAVHHRYDDANSNVRAVFSKLESLDNEVYPTHSFGDEIINLSEAEIEERIDEHQRFFYTEYRYPCNRNRFFCHTSSMDTILRDTLFQKWLFRQYKKDPEAIAITSIDEDYNYTIRWEAKTASDGVEVWFRSNTKSKWLMAGKVPAGTGFFNLRPAVAERDIRLSSKVRLVVFNEDHFVYGMSESRIKRIVSDMPDKYERGRHSLSPQSSH